MRDRDRERDRDRDRDRDRRSPPPPASDSYVPNRSPRRQRSRSAGRYRNTMRGRSRDDGRWHRSRSRPRSPRRSSPRRSPRRSPLRYPSPRRDDRGRNDRARSPPHRDFGSRDGRCVLIFLFLRPLIRLGANHLFAVGDLARHPIMIACIATAHHSGGHPLLVLAVISLGLVVGIVEMTDMDPHTAEIHHLFEILTCRPLSRLGQLLDPRRHGQARFEVTRIDQESSLLFLALHTPAPAIQVKYHLERLRGLRILNLTRHCPVDHPQEDRQL